MEGKGGEVRRLHIIYFLSRMGRVEQPHLIRVHHLNRNGVYLRDVKRWLSDLRGKEMAEAFAWSYKRKYKTGYVWQDLLNDDLITPISDNEYVLKGSQITGLHLDPCEKNASTLKQQEVEIEVEDENEGRQQRASTGEASEGHPDSKIHTPMKTSSEIIEESPPFSSETSTVTDYSMKFEEDKSLERSKQEMSERDLSFENSSSSSFYSNPINKKSKTKKKKKTNNVEKSSAAPSSSFASFTKSKSHSSGASQVFRNLMTCGAVDTKDSALVMMNCPDKTMNKLDCRAEKLGGSARILGLLGNINNSNTAAEGLKKKGEFANLKAASAAFKPVATPSCSQCGKSFKPEKMHTHMKSCRGKKASAKSAAAVEKTPSRPANSCNTDSVPGYFLTH
ncbi:Protein UPSTREAM OF FLC [Vitis vinifera]|uniref:Protein UPSTREAM OF FLC n=1 Tax=Vitis vinifera TaxID=29760 RepID=A0A438IA08_VITVI|nr:Protein UPSTREAM OF FLC [Vitis vinifera]